METSLFKIRVNAIEYCNGMNGMGLTDEMKEKLYKAYMEGAKSVIRESERKNAEKDDIQFDANERCGGVGSSYADRRC